MKIDKFDLIHSNDFEKVLDIIREFGVEIIYQSKPRTITETFGFLWWRKNYVEKWVTITMGHDDNDFDFFEPLREAVSRGLSIV